MSADLDVLVALMPFAGQLGLVLDEARADRVIARLAWAPHLCTSGGIMYGGVLMSLADTAGAPGRPDHADPGRASSPLRHRLAQGAADDLADVIAGQGRPLEHLLGALVSG
jgi:acyl-coenzyme A thioesterase PaaI-like protein